MIVYIREEDREDVHSTDVQTQKILPRHHSAFRIRLEKIRDGYVFTISSMLRIQVEPNV